MERNPFLSAFFPKCFHLCWFLLLFLTQVILVPSQQQGLQCWQIFYGTELCCGTTHPLDSKGCCSQPPKRALKLDFQLNLEILSKLWNVSVKEGFFTRKPGVLVFFSSNNHFLSPNQTAEAFSCHTLTPGLCFPPVDVATSKGSAGSCVLCSLLMSSPRWWEEHRTKNSPPVQCQVGFHMTLLGGKLF